MNEDTVTPEPEDEAPGAPDAALVPVQQQIVTFYGDEITGVLIQREGKSDEWYIPLRLITEFLGLSWPAQYRRTKSDEVLGPALISVAIIATQKGKRGQRDRTLLCLPLHYLPGWLFGISSSKVKPDLAAKITLYRRECFDVLWRAFAPQILPTVPSPTDLTPAGQALMLAEAVASLARQHLALEQRHTAMADYMRPFVGQTRGQLAGHEERIGALELRLGTGATISEAEASELQQAVKQVSNALHKRTGQQLSTAFQLVWGELYKRYRVGAYRNLPAAQYDAALSWLRSWYEELTSPEAGPEQPSAP